jgi:hypothetical protein
VSDRLHSSIVIPADEVSPDSITAALTDAVRDFEDSLDVRAERGLPIAVDWNGFRLVGASIFEASDSHGRPGDLRVQASVPVL